MSPFPRYGKESARTRRGQRSMALVVVLLMIAVMSVAVIAFVVTMKLQRQASLSYSQSFKADQLAQGGAWWVVKELHDEIAAGGSSDNNNNYPLYTNFAATNMMPLPVGTNAAMVSLLKTSTNGTSSYVGQWASPNGGVLPSPVRTSTPSLNGRYVDAARWSEPCLGNFPSDDSADPYWIMVTRSGPASVTNGASPAAQLASFVNVADQNNYVIGRFAYAVYDEGGLIDINLAGYPAQFNDGSALAASDLARKGSPGLMDLTAIPNLTTAQIQSLIAWRNAGSETNMTAYTNYLYTTTLTTTNGPAGTVLQATNSFGTTNNYLYVPPGDNFFLSRQDLIAYAQAQGMTNILPYVTTFSRDVNAPSFSPFLWSAKKMLWPGLNNPQAGGYSASVTPVPSSGYVGATGTFNPCIPAIRQANGRPLVSQRFPLSRLSLFANPTGTNLSMISNYFGLTNNSDGYSWTYYRPTGTIAPISQLWQVATNTAHPRSPDFFEMLQAGVLQGSLSPVNPGSANATGAWVSAVTMQMGANIIDQYTTDNWPTVINFNKEIYAGNKSLPYLSEFLQWTYRPITDSEADTNRNDIMMLCPIEFWNPYQNSTNLPASGPINLRVLLEPSGATNGALANVYWKLVGATTNTVGSHTNAATMYLSGTSTAYGITTDLNYPANTVDANKPNVTFTNSTVFHEPSLITNGTGTLWTNFAETNFAGITNYMSGLLATQYDFPDARLNTNMFANTNTAYEYKSSGLDVSGTADLAFLVQFQDPNNTNIWHPYQGYAGTTAVSTQITEISFNINQGAMTYADNSTATPYGPTVTGSTSGFTNFNFFANSAGLADPRAYLWQIQYEQASPNFSIRPNLKDAGAYKGRGGNFPEGYSFPYTPDTAIFLPNPPGHAYEGMFNENWSNNIFTSANPSWTLATNTYQYDVDGIIRPADGYLGTNANPFLANNATSFAARPIILNRPFRSVGELGFAFRGQAPWKSINFFNTNSADMGLLDLFGNDPAPLVAGKINLNTRQPVTLQAALQGAYITENIGGQSLTTNSITMSSNFAQAIVNYTANNAFINRADLVRQFAQNSAYTTYLSSTDATLKSHREAVVRPLAELGTTRTWSLLIDVVAQVGHYPPNATDMSQFIVEGERRYWLHVAIDRVTGQVVDQKLELYNE